MKKITKIFMLLMCVSFAFVFSACGNALDTEVNVDTGKESDYVLCTSANSFATKMQTVEVPEQVNCAKFTLKANMLTDMFGSPATFEVNLNAMVTIDEQDVEDLGEDDIGLAIKGNIKGVTEDDIVFSLYLKDGVVYVEAMDEKIKIDSDDLESDESEPAESFDFSPILEQVGAFMGSEDLVEKVIENGDDATYQLALGTAKVYIVITNNKLNQVLYTATNVDISEMIGSLLPEETFLPSLSATSISLAMEYTNSAISYPSFNDYQDFSESEYTFPGFIG